MSVLVRFEPSGRAISVSAGTTLIEAIDRAGLPIARACGADGVCCRCGVQILEGEDRLPPETTQERQLKERNRIDPSLRLSCRATVEAPLVVRALYW